MDIRHIRAFITLSKTLHFARAAEGLGISAPTLTAQIQELERLLQARLFERTKRSVSLTPAGDVFLVQAHATLEQIEKAIQIGRLAGRGQLGRVEIGYVGSASFFGVLQDQIRRFRARWPDVVVNTKEFPTEQLTALLDERRIDIAFVRTPVTLLPSIASHALARDRFCLAVPVDHPLALVVDPVPSAMLADERFVVPEQELGLREVSRRGGFSAQVVSAPGTLVAVLTQVALGVGIAIVPSIVIQATQLPGVIFKEIAGAVIISEVEALFRRHERLPTVCNLIDQIKGTDTDEWAITLPCNGGRM
ncbi:LysR family transcriptional regulator [Pseudomonas fluorescens BBc6R8]|uniref:LysR family transcriptional regulator n=1 Tax=Pseudomonas fluorescens TaxID=294 RepID=UPI000281CA28|nr:LysR family transcriptional regulator [Pseudomonas fluorescens]QQD55356.1 LysR family transcriptional regulator [Pseudomonas fluorescens BBc6R8]